VCWKKNGTKTGVQLKSFKLQDPANHVIRPIRKGELDGVRRHPAPEVVPITSMVSRLGDWLLIASCAPREMDFVPGPCLGVPETDMRTTAKHGPIVQAQCQKNTITTYLSFVSASSRQSYDVPYA